MLALSGTLAAAQKRFDVEPAVSVLVADLPPESPRLAELVSHYSGTEPDQQFDACYIPGSASIGRAYADGTGKVYAQVVAIGAGAASWSVWSTLDTGAYAYGGVGAPVAVWASGSELVVYWLAADGHTMRMATWSGSSWSGYATAADAGGGWLVAGLGADSADSTQRLFYVVSGSQTFETHYSGGVWSAPVGDGVSYSLPTIGVGYRASDATYSVMIASDSPSVLKVRTFDVGSGTWASTATDEVLLTAGVNSGYSYGYPRISEASSAFARPVVTWSETAPSPLGTVPQICFTPDHGWVTNAVPWRYASSYGVKVFRDTNASPNWWIVTASEVYSAPADTGSSSLGQRIRFDVDQVVGVTIRLDRENRPGRVEVTLLNGGGATTGGSPLQTAGQAGAYLGLRQWSQVAVTLGYHTGSGSGGYGLVAGDEGIVQVPAWIEQIVFHDDVQSGMPLVTLYCVDGWGLLDLVRVRATITYSGLSAAQLLALIWWQVAGTAVSGLSALASLTVSPFTLNAGETYGSAALRLCEMCGVVLRFKTSQSSVDGTGLDSVIAEPVAWGTGGSVYSYGPSGHPIVSSLIAPFVVPSATSAEVSGASTVSLGRDWSSIWLLWREITVRLVDKALANQAATDAAAAGELAWLAPELRGGELVTLGNVGVEVGDQVDVTITSAPVSAQVYTVAGYDVVWSRDHGVILQTLRLEGSN